jgi:ABC-type phosphate/phosphonate transport system ATPase subunit
MAEVDPKLQFDKELLAVYLTGLQAEVEAKLRSVNRFREHMQRLDDLSGPAGRQQREEAARALLQQVEGMLDANRVVREILQEIRMAAAAVLEDISKP